MLGRASWVRHHQGQLSNERQKVARWMRVGKWVQAQNRILKSVEMRRRWGIPNIAQSSVWLESWVQCVHLCVYTHMHTLRFGKMIKKWRWREVKTQIQGNLFFFFVSVTDLGYMWLHCFPQDWIMWSGNQLDPIQWKTAHLACTGYFWYNLPTGLVNDWLKNSLLPSNKTCL